MSLNDYMESNGLYECPVAGDAAAPAVHYPSSYYASTTTQASSLFATSLLSSVRGIVIVAFRYYGLPGSPSASNQQLILSRADTGAELTRIVVASSVNGAKLGFTIEPGIGFGIKWGGTDATAYGGRLMWKWYGG